MYPTTIEDKYVGMGCKKSQFILYNMKCLYTFYNPKCPSVRKEPIITNIKPCMVQNTIPKANLILVDSIYMSDYH